VVQAMAYQAEILFSMERFEDAEAILQEALDIISEQPNQGRTSELIHATFVRLYEAWGKSDLADSYRALSRRAS